MSETGKIAVVGFGYIGSVLGAVLAERGANVVGIDRSERIVHAVRQGTSPFNEPGLDDLIARNVKAGRLYASADADSIEGCHTFVITVGTPLSESGEPDLSHIRQAAELVSSYVKNKDLVLVKSTVPPFTTEDVVAPIVRRKATPDVAFSPERLAEGRAIEELTSIPIVVGGLDGSSTKAAADFWKRTLGVEVIEMSSARAAEMVKLADNMWIDLNIALAGELAMLSDKLNIDVLEVIRAANTLPKVDHHVNILLPSIGVGGYCLTKDPWFVHRLGQSYGLELRIPSTSRWVNDRMPGYSVSLIDEFLCRNGRNPSSLTIAVMGIAFKNNTGDCRFTPTKMVIDSLRAKGYRLRICDPFVTDDDARAVTDLPLLQDPRDALKGADCAAFLTGHRQFHALKPRELAALLRPGALVFDGRMFYSTDSIQQMRAQGLAYKGVGR